MEQTVEEGTVASVIVNVIDENGSHVSATISESTTRLQKGNTSDTTWNNAVPTIDTISTGVYRINFTGLSPAISFDDNDELVRVKINGNIDGEPAWTEYHMPLKVLTPEGSGGGGGGDATAANQAAIISHLTDVKGAGWTSSDNLAEIANDVSGLDGDPMRGTDGANTVAPDNASIASILADTDELQGNQGDWATADVSGLSSQASVDALQSTADSILADTDDLQSNQGQWLTADVSALATQASIDALNDFDPASDTVANVATVALCSSNSDMRGTDGALLQSNMPLNWPTMIIGTGSDEGKVTTSNPAAGSGSSHTAQDVANLILGGDRSPIVMSSGSISNVVLVDTTTDLTNGGGGEDASTIYSYFTSGSRPDPFKADVSGLSTFDSTTDQVVASNMRGTDNALTSADAPSNFDVLLIDGSGKVTTSNPASGGGSAHTAEDVRDLILGGDKTPIDVNYGSVSNVILVDTTTNLTNGGGGSGGGSVTVKATPTPRAF